MNLSLALSCWIVIVSARLISCANRCGRLSYKELEKMGASCSPDDTCSAPRDAERDVIPEYRCQCKASCLRTNTCCIDSPHVRFMAAYRNRNRGTCQYPITTTFSILMVSQCHPSWRGDPVIKSLCENPSDQLKDPIGQAPVTNMRSEITYSNYFCAVCNNGADSLKLWTVKLTKVESYIGRGSEESLDQNNILDKLILNEQEEWVVVTNDEKGNKVTELVTIEFIVPSGLDKIVFPCVFGLVSECKDGWRDEYVRWMCHSYMGIVYLSSNTSPTDLSPHIPYRNIYCAICNDVDYSPRNVCHRQISPSLGPGKPPLSFTLLLDVNLSDGDKVGEINRCGRGKMYDPFFKKCRELACGVPGYVIKGDKCVPP